MNRTVDPLTRWDAGAGSVSSSAWIGAGRVRSPRWLQDSQRMPREVRAPRLQIGMVRSLSHAQEFARRILIGRRFA